MKVTEPLVRHGLPQVGLPIAFSWAAQPAGSRRLLPQCGPLTGFLPFTKVTVPLVNRGLPQVALPMEYSRAPQPAVSSPLRISRFDQPPVGPVLFLRANQFIDDWQGHPQEFMAGQSP